MQANHRRDKHLGLRIDPETHYKLHYIARYEERSGNGEVLAMIRGCIQEYERKHGEIEVPKEPPGE